MMAETPQTAEPTASRLVSFGLSLNHRPSSVMRENAVATSSRTNVRLSPPSVSTSPSRKREHQEQYACLEPELVGGNTGPEYLGDPNGVRHRENDQDGPQHILDVGNVQVVRLSVGRDRLFDELTEITDRCE